MGLRLLALAALGALVLAGMAARGVSHFARNQAGATRHGASILTGSISMA